MTEWRFLTRFACLPLVLTACGVITVNGKPLDGSSPPPEQTSGKSETAAESKNPQQRDWDARMEIEHTYQREIGSSGRPRTDAFALARETIASYQAKKGAPVGERVPVDVMLEEARRHLADSPFDQRKEALDVWREAKAAAAPDQPTNTGDKDELLNQHFRDLAHSVKSTLGRVASWDFTGMDETGAGFDKAVADYEASDLGGRASARARALADEGKQICKKYASEIARYRKAQDGFERDPSRERIAAKSQDLQAKMDNLRAKVGLGGGDSGCGATSPDPVDRQRLQALCALSHQYDAVEAQWKALNDRYFGPLEAKRARHQAEKDAARSGRAKK
jgi:hypothetical protein